MELGLVYKYALAKGYSFHATGSGGYVHIPAGSFEKSFLNGIVPIPVRPKKKKEIMLYPIPIQDFGKLKDLLRKYRINEDYLNSFCILYCTVKNEHERSKVSDAKDYELLAKLASRFNEEFPKSVTIKYPKKESYTLPLDVIAMFWASFQKDLALLASNDRTPPVDSLATPIVKAVRRIEPKLMAKNVLRFAGKILELATGQNRSSEAIRKEVDRAAKK